MTRIAILLVICASFMASLGGCAKHDLRGKAVRSTDGKTYLVVEDNNGGGCGPIQIDGREWPYPIHAPGPTEPGAHKISCGDPSYFLEFQIPSGTTFHFDYWGP